MKNLRAFTLIELLVVIAVLALLCSVIAPGLASTRPNNASARCQNNLRILSNAWRMYSDDNSGKLIPNLHGAAAVGGAGYGTLGMGWVEGWQDWTARPDNTNLLFLSDVRWSRVASYVNREPKIFKCPADRFVSSIQVVLGWTQRARSYSIPANLGIGNYEEGPSDNLYKHVTNETALIYPTPAETVVYLDEHPDSMNDPVLWNPHLSSWVDIPATYHNGAASIVFADGHTEIHEWVGSLTSPRARRVAFTDGSDLPSAVVLGDADLHWMSYHSSRRSTNSY